MGKKPTIRDFFTKKRENTKAPIQKESSDSSLVGEAVKESFQGTTPEAKSCSRMKHARQDCVTTECGEPGSSRLRVKKKPRIQNADTPSSELPIVENKTPEGMKVVSPVSSMPEPPSPMRYQPLETQAESTVTDSQFSQILPGIPLDDNDALLCLPQERGKLSSPRPIDSQECRTPKPIPRQSMPANYKYEVSSSRTPRLIPPGAQKAEIVANANDATPIPSNWEPVVNGLDANKSFSLFSPETQREAIPFNSQETQERDPGSKRSHVAQRHTLDCCFLERKEAAKDLCENEQSAKKSQKKLRTIRQAKPKGQDQSSSHAKLPLQLKVNAVCNFGQSSTQFDNKYQVKEGKEVSGANSSTTTSSVSESAEMVAAAAAAGAFERDPTSSNVLEILMETAKSVQERTAVHNITSLFSNPLGAVKLDDLAHPSFDPDAFPAESFLCDTSTKLKTPSKSFRLSLLCSTFDQIEALKGSGTGSKKKVTTLLTNLFRCIIWWSPFDLIPVVYISINKLCPDYMGLEVGVGENTLIKLMVEVYGRTEKSLKGDMKQFEDLGRVAENSRRAINQLKQPKALAISTTFHDIKSLGQMTGKASLDKKKSLIKRLLTAAEKSEAKTLIRFLQGKMRIGIQAPSVYQALAFAFVLTTPQMSPFGEIAKPACSDIRRATKVAPSKIDETLALMDAAVRTALYEVSNVEVVIQHLFEGCDPVTLLERCVVTPGIPVQPMLAKPTKGLQEVFDRFSDMEFTCEYKYDGERAQIHLMSDGTVAVFSRNLENVTEKYPDVINAAKEAFNDEVQECIVDSEVVAFDTVTQEIRPFQILATRKRKGVEEKDVTVKVCVFAFDCIQFNGSSLTKIPLYESEGGRIIFDYPVGVNSFIDVFMRFPANLVLRGDLGMGNVYQAALNRHSEMTTIDEVDSFLQEAIMANCEGLMVKTLKTSASYEPAKRSLNWLKIKKDYLDNLSDSVDLVPIGAFFGTGKRSKYYGTYLLACYDPEEEAYQTVCKTATGFTDESLKDLWDKFQDKVTLIRNQAYQVHEKLNPDVWFEPCMVWEIKAADLSLSPVHSGAMGLRHESKGIGLRFPRFIRVRPDKKPENATTNDQIAEMYSNQFNKELNRNSILPEGSDH